MEEIYVGFHWTFPLPRIGLRHLPRDPAAAAANSITIRYQRAAAHRYVTAVEGRPEGRLIGEIAFLDTQPDRSTDTVREAVDRVRAVTGGGDAEVIHAAFDERSLRDNRHLVEYPHERDIERIPLSPEPIDVDGERLDPIRQLADRRDRETAAMTALRLGAYAGLRTAMPESPSGEGRWRAIADRLNAEGIRTVRGRRRPLRNVRKRAGLLQRERER